MLWEWWREGVFFIYCICVCCCQVGIVVLHECCDVCWR
jgi:hypothetical protein